MNKSFGVDETTMTIPTPESRAMLYSEFKLGRLVRHRCIDIKILEFEKFCNIVVEFENKLYQAVYSLALDAFIVRDDLGEIPKDYKLRDEYKVLWLIPVKK